MLAAVYDTSTSACGLAGIGITGSNSCTDTGAACADSVHPPSGAARPGPPSGAARPGPPSGAARLGPPSGAAVAGLGSAQPCSSTPARTAAATRLVTRILLIAPVTAPGRPGSARTGRP